MEPRSVVRRLAVAAALAALACVPAASASNVRVTLVVNPGPLSLSLNSTGAITFTVAGPSRSTFTVPLRLEDDTGSGLGWRLTVRASTLTAAANPAGTLSGAAITVQRATVSCAAGSTCGLPVNAVRYPVVVPVGDVDSPAADLLDAAPGSGLGAFSVSLTVRVALPRGVRPGTYSGELTLALVSGP